MLGVAVVIAESLVVGWLEIPKMGMLNNNKAMLPGIKW